MNFYKKINYTGTDYLFFVLSLIIAYGLKKYYSLAASVDFYWILWSTSQMVGFLTNIPFILEKGTGFVNQDIMVINAKSCAGINFIIVSFCMSVFTLLPLMKQTRIKLIVFAGCLTGAYLISIMVNSLRILIGIYLFSNNLYSGRFTQERVHHIEGIVFYFLFLWAIYFSIEKLKPQMVGDKKI